jgi:hypothetical protein
VHCPHGLRLHTTSHDPAVQALVPFLDAILGASRVTAERGGHGGQRAMDQWMQNNPISHAPDIVLRDYDKPNSYVLLDIKTLDAAGPSHVATHHTDRSRPPPCPLGPPAMATSTTPMILPPSSMIWMASTPLATHTLNEQLRQWWRRSPSLPSLTLRIPRQRRGRPGGGVLRWPREGGRGGGRHRHMR